VLDVRMLLGRGGGGVWLGIDGGRDEVIGAGDRDGAFEFISCVLMRIWESRGGLEKLGCLMIFWLS
jgi:hypothetical protein